MVGISGVVGRHIKSLEQLKRLVLYFDRLYLFELSVGVDSSLPMPCWNDLQYLKSRNLVQSLPHEAFFSFSMGYYSDFAGEEESSAHFDISSIVKRQPKYKRLANYQINDHLVRVAAHRLHEVLGEEAVPVVTAATPNFLAKNIAGHETFKQTVLRVAFESVPTPEQNCSIEAITLFKEDTRDQKWALRRFLNSLATKQLGEAEIRDEIEWAIHEYEKAMRLHELKVRRTRLEVLIVTPMELLENIVKLNISKITRGLLQMRKQEVELLEAETKASGRECAYLYSAQKRFVAQGRKGC